MPKLECLKIKPKPIFRLAGEVFTIKADQTAHPELQKMKTV
jgi:hypothetical protein